jgi:hypothetical protein
MLCAGLLASYHTFQNVLALILFSGLPVAAKESVLNIWFLVWVFFTVFIFGIFFWSVRILLQQRASWKTFAARNGMDYAPGRMLQPPTLYGTYRGTVVKVFSQQQQTQDNRGARFRTVIQATLPAGMKTEGVIASADNKGFVTSLNLEHEVRPDFSGWDESILVRASDPAALKAYLTDERCRSLGAIMTIKTMPCVFLFDQNVAYLRFETADPLIDPDKMDRLLVKVAEAAKSLSP